MFDYDGFFLESGSYIMRRLETATTTTPNNDDFWRNYGWDDDNIYYQMKAIDQVQMILLPILNCMSLISAICIVLETFADHKAGAGTTVTHILFMSQLAMIPSWIASVVGTLAIPPHVEPRVPSANGNIATCEAQAFFITFGFAAGIPLDIVLSITYVLMVRYNIRKDMLRKMEPFVFAIILCFALSFSTSALILDLYNPDWDSCFFNSVPFGCEDGSEDSLDCLRGDWGQVEIFLNIFIVLALIAIVVSISSMTSIYLYARSIERRNLRYSSGLTRANSGEIYSRKIALKGIMYSGTIILAMLPRIIEGILGIFFNIWNPVYALIAVSSISLFGFYYLLVFLHNRSEMRTMYGRILRRLIYCHCIRRCYTNNKTKIVKYLGCKKTPTQKEEEEQQVAVATTNRQEEKEEITTQRNDDKSTSFLSYNLDKTSLCTYNCGGRSKMFLGANQAPGDQGG